MTTKVTIEAHCPENVRVLISRGQIDEATDMIVSQSVTVIKNGEVCVENIYGNQVIQVLEINEDELE